LTLVVRVDKDVRRLQVAMHHAPHVRGLEGAGDPAGDGKRAPRLKGLGGHRLLQGRGIDELHDQVSPTVGQG
jgi:hypothetical protein